MINKALTPAEHYTERMNDGFWKHYIDLIDENGKPFQVILHHFTKPDEGDPHNHPGTIISQLISGSYLEKVYDVNNPNKEPRVILREKGDTNVIHAHNVHQIVDLPEGECWTIAHYGNHVQKSGFYRFEDDSVRHRYWDEQEFRPYKPEQ